LTLDASGLAGAGNGPFGLSSVDLSIGFQLVVMLFVAGQAVVSLCRGSAPALHLDATEFRDGRWHRSNSAATGWRRWSELIDGAASSPAAQ
jgi:hypothetical protein